MQHKLTPQTSLHGPSRDGCTSALAGVSRITSGGTALLLLAVAVLCMPGFAIAGAESAPASQAAPVGPARLLQLLRAIESDDDDVRSRAVSELAHTAPAGSSAQDALLRFVFSGRINRNDPIWCDLLRVLPKRASADRMAALYSAQRRSVEDQTDEILILLSRMGDRAASAVPFLLNLMDKQEGNTVPRGALLVVLANVGSEPDRRVKELETLLAGEGSGSEGALEMLSLSGTGSWISPPIIQDRMKRLDSQSVDDRLSAAFVLGALPADKVTSKIVGRLMQLANTGGDESAAFCLAVAAIDPAHRMKVMRRGLREIELQGNAHLTLALAGWFPDSLLGDLGKMAGDDDEQVAAGAIELLSLVGLSAHSAAPNLIALIEEGQHDEELRGRAAEAMAAVGGVDDLPRLQKLELSELSEESRVVRESLRETIRILNLREHAQAEGMPARKDVESPASSQAE